MADRIINQPWEDVADDVTLAIEKAVQPLLKKATGDIYAGLLDATQDYLRDNLAFNIAERIDAAERQADYDRRECERLRSLNSRLLAALMQVARPYGMLDLAVCEHANRPRGDDMLEAARVVRDAIAHATQGDA